MKARLLNNCHIVFPHRVYKGNLWADTFIALRGEHQPFSFVMLLGVHMQNNELAKTALKTYLTKYPSYKNFFHDVIEKDKTLYKIWLYTYSPVEDIALRQKLEKKFPGILNRTYIQQLLIREGNESKLYEPLQQLNNDFHLVKYADTWKIRKGDALKKQGIETIEQIRENLGKHLWRTKEREYSVNGERVEEATLYEWYPFFLFRMREIFDRESKKTKKIEAELDFPDWNRPAFEQLKYFWEKYSVTEILQTFRDMSEIEGIVWNIKPNIEYSIIISHKNERKEFPLNLLERYYNLVRSAMKKYPLEEYDYIPDEKAGNLELGIYNDLSRKLNFLPAILAVLNFSLEYREEKHGNFPGYLECRIYSHLNDIRKSKEFTTTALLKTRRDKEAYECGDSEEQKKRLLLSELESSEGSFDDETLNIDGKEIIRIDLQKDDKYPEDSPIKYLDPEMLKDFNKFRNSLTDLTNKEIFTLYCDKNKTMDDIGKRLGLTKQAVHKRMKKEGERFRKMME